MLTWDFVGRGCLGQAGFEARLLVNENVEGPSAISAALRFMFRSSGTLRDQWPQSGRPSVRPRSRSRAPRPAGRTNKSIRQPPWQCRPMTPEIPKHFSHINPRGDNRGLQTGKRRPVQAPSMLLRAPLQCRMHGRRNVFERDRFHDETISPPKRLSTAHKQTHALRSIRYQELTPYSDGWPFPFFRSTITVATRLASLLSVRPRHLCASRVAPCHSSGVTG